MDFCRVSYSYCNRFLNISPLFINITVDEPIPENIAIDAYNKFETIILN